MLIWWSNTIKMRIKNKLLSHQKVPSRKLKKQKRLHHLKTESTLIKAK